MYYLTASFIILFNFVLVWLVLNKKTLKKGLIVSLFLLNIGLASWQIILLTTKYLSDTDLLHRLAFITASSALLGGLGLSFYYPNKTLNSKTSKILIFLGGIEMLFSSLILFSNLVISKYDLTTKNVVFGKFGILFLLFIISLLLTTILGFILRFFKESYEKIYFKYVFIAFFVYGVTALFLNLVLPIFRITEFTTIGSLIAFIPQSAFVYTLVANRLYRLNYVTGQLGYTILRAVFYYLFFYLIAIGQFKFSGGIFNKQAYFSGIFVAIIFTLIVIIAERKFRSYLESRILYGEFSPLKIRDYFSKETSIELDIDKLTLKITGILQKVFSTNKTAIIIFDNTNSKILYKQLRGFDNIESLNLRDLLEIIHYWHEFEHPPIVIKNELQNNNINGDKRIQRILNFLEKNEIEIIIPLNRKVQLNGLCILGKKTTQEPYTVQDVDLLEILISMGGVAIGRSLLYENVENFNTTLQQKIDIATEELRKKVEALKEAQRKERDMLDIMGHELRTPISIVKGSFAFQEMLLNKLLPPNADEMNKKKLVEYNDRIRENIEREIKLIDIFLGATQIDKGKLNLAKESVDIIDVVEDGIVGQQKQAEKKNLVIKFIKPENSQGYPKIFADRARIQEVVDNLLSNAVKYTDKGGITINLEDNADMITVHVKDTGKGIPANELQNLGKKFYRVQQYTEGSSERDLKMVRAGGTGLGLYVTYGLVKAHGGEIWVDSELGKGSTFHFSIPKYQSQTDTIQKSTTQESDVFKRLGLKK